MPEAELFEATEGFDLEKDEGDPSTLKVVFKNDEGEVTAMPVSFHRDEQGMYSMVIHNISDFDNFRIVNDKIQIL